MEVNELIALLKQPESSVLEFKREAYRIDDENPETKKRQRDELIKDILALANGNSITAGDIAHLIIGADDKLNPDGIRTIYDVQDRSLSSTRILDLVNSACEPSIEDIFCQEKEIEGKHLLVITISPTPYLHETIRRLEPPPHKVFTERTVFVRHNQTIEVATQKEREAIAQLKRFRFGESRNPPGELFGALTGGLAGGLMGYALTLNSDKTSEFATKRGGKEAVGVVGAIFGGIVGSSLGDVYKNFYEIRSNWHRVPPLLRLPLLLGSLLVGIIGTRFITFLLGLVLPKKQ